MERKSDRMTDREFGDGPRMDIWRDLIARADGGDREALEYLLGIESLPEAWPPPEPPARVVSAESQMVSDLCSGLRSRYPWMDAETSKRRAQYEFKERQRACRHPSMPKRALGEEYMDTCPDCGFTAYCYRIG